MVILEREKAIEYLKKVRSCFHHEDHFSNLRLVSKMLDVEIALFAKLMLEGGADKRLNLAVDSTGFPELESWKKDVAFAMQEYELIRAKRAKVLLPFLDQLKNASIDLNLQVIQNICKTHESDYQFASCIGDMEDGGRRQLAKHGGGGLSPLFTRQEYPGLLLVTNTISAFQGFCSVNGYTRTGDSENGFCEVPSVAGLKFIDGNIDGTCPPFTIYVPIKEVDGKEIQGPWYRLLLPCSSVAGRTAYAPYLNKTHFLTLIYPEGSVGNFSERSLSLTHKTALKALLSADLSGVSDDDRSAFLDAVIKLGAFLEELERFCNESLSGKAINPEESVQGLTSLWEQRHALLSTVQNDELKLSLQIGVAEGSASIQKLAVDAALGRPQLNPGIPQTKRLSLKSFWGSALVAARKVVNN